MQLQKQHFKEVQGGFVQILNVHKSHWISVSNVGREANAINIHDSTYATLDKKKIVLLGDQRVIT